MEQLDCLFDLEYSLNCIRAEEREEGREIGREIGREEGREIGREIGREEGVKFKTVETVKNMLARGYDYSEIAFIAGTTREKVSEIALTNG